MAQLLSNLPNGSKVKFGKHQISSETPWDIKWIIVGKNQTEYKNLSNHVTLLTQYCIDTFPYDSAEIGGTSMRWKYGNNNYELSNIRQWLCSNKKRGEWYTSTHSNDNPPVAPGYYGMCNYYAERDGFLYHFTADEQNAILPSQIYVGFSALDSTSGKYLTDKVFLPSHYNLHQGSSDSEDYFVGGGSKWSYVSSYAAGITKNVSGDPNAVEAGIDFRGYYMTRNPLSDSSAGNIYCSLSMTDAITYRASAQDENGVRPVVNLSGDTLVSDTTDSEGCYSVVFNSAPIAPSTLNIPSTIQGGRINTISWGKTTDPDFDEISYVLEVAFDGGAFAEIFNGTATTCNHAVPYGLTSAIYRVKAVDSKGAASGYTTSESREITNNIPPEINGVDTDLGIKTEGFSQSYIVTDVDSNDITVTEALDGQPIRTYVCTLGATCNAVVNGETWLKLSNGAHSLTITAKDPQMATTTRTYTFTKNVTVLTIENTEPLEASTMPTRIVLTVNRNLPPEAILKVDVCNNGYDAEPVWEDATNSVVSNLVHVFENKSKIADRWGVKIRVTVDRNGGEGTCYISGIGGNFE